MRFCGIEHLIESSANDNSVFFHEKHNQIIRIRQFYVHCKIFEVRIEKLDWDELFQFTNSKNQFISEITEQICLCH